MSLELANHEEQALEAVRLFWNTREAALSKAGASDAQDTGERGAVTAGKNMDGFLNLARSLVLANGLDESCVLHSQRALTLPGFFRPAKAWDMLVLSAGKLVAALEFKSQVGPSFGNNFNNRTEEAIGSAKDFWTTYREGAFGDGAPKPFLGWLILVEDSEESRSAVKIDSPHFAADARFEGASYCERYDILCRRLVQENLYSAASLLVSPRSAGDDGSYRDASELSSLKNFTTQFAGHIAAWAAR